MDQYNKDLFSQHSEKYAMFRPKYPVDLYRFIYSHCKSFEVAWDCATGNGQAAQDLALKFNKVFASDFSEQQIQSAVGRANIIYSVCPAEQTPFADNTFNLITVAQAAHWLPFDTFYKEVKRVAKPNATIAIWGYGLLSVHPEIDKLISNFYTNIIGMYWDKERKHIDQQYQAIPFPFIEIPTSEFEMIFEWTLQELEGYLNTWSAVQKFSKANQFNPVNELIELIRMQWKNKMMRVQFPLFLRLGTVSKEI